MPAGEEQIDAFMAAISGQESGGDPNVLNRSGSGAQGLFQIMPDNWGPWAAQAGLGANAPKTHENQRTVARHKMLEYFRRFGSWEAVAVAWYAGEGTAAKWVKNPNDPSWDRPQSYNGDEYPSINSYAKKATSGMGGGAPVSASSTGGPTSMSLPPNATEDQIVEFIGANYGPDIAAFLDVPELRALLIDSGQRGESPDLFATRLRGTEWWRTNSAATRQYFALSATDPAQLESMVSAKVDELEAIIAPLGLNLGGPEGVRQWAENSLRYGWTTDQLQEKLTAQLRHGSETRGIDDGTEIDLSADALMAMARNEYFVPISRADAERWAIDIFSGAKTEDTMRSYFARLADSRFPGLAENGFTPGEYMAPVRTLIAETLELNPADVDLLDRRWSEVLETQGKDGTFRPMTLGEAGRWARQRPEYTQTQGAKGEAAGLAETLGRTFGVVA